MFYSQFILAKKGPLGRVWLASHWPKKLTKAHIFQADLVEYVDNIINPQAPLALRLSGHLMLGVIRIYSRKTKYLMTDCNDALVKLKMAFKSGTVDLERSDVKAAYASVTLADDPNNLDYLQLEDHFATGTLDESYVNTSRPEDITLTDDQFSTSFTVDQVHFGGGFEEDEVVVPTIKDGGADTSVSSMMDRSVEVARAGSTVPDESFAMDDMQVDIDAPVDATAPLGKVNESEVSFAEGTGRPGDEFDDDNNFGADSGLDEDDLAVSMGDTGIPEVNMTMDDLEEVAGPDMAPRASGTEQNEKVATAIVLQPLEEAVIKHTIAKKRRIIIDRVVDLGSHMRKHVENASELVRTDFKRPTRVCRRERLLAQRRKEPLERIFELPSVATVNERFHATFQIYMHTNGVKRRRLMEADAGMNQDDGTSPEPEIQRDARHSPDGDIRPNEDMDQIDLPPQEEFDDDAGLPVEPLEEDDQTRALGDEEEPEVGNPDFDDVIPEVPLDLDEEETQHHTAADAEGSIAVSDDENNDEDDDGINKTNDEYQSRGWSKRTVKVLKRLDRKFKEAEETATEEPPHPSRRGRPAREKPPTTVSFEKLATGHSRLAVANLFYECLMLKTRGCIETSQTEAHGDITLGKSDVFETQLEAITA